MSLLNLLSGKKHKLKPLFISSSYQEYKKKISEFTYLSKLEYEEKLVKNSNHLPFFINGYCIPCGKKVKFLVDYKYEYEKSPGLWFPNWRERVECLNCKLNNRQRLISSKIKESFSDRNPKKIYLTEQVMPIYDWANKNFNNHQIFGSEFLGIEYQPGQIVNGIRNENIENLSFENNYFDLLISNDVLEHVPNPTKAFEECFRVLKIGGSFLFTIPFFLEKEKTEKRANVKNDKIEYLQPPVYHGNPLSKEGSLVFTDFGWDLMEILKKIGFQDSRIEFYSDLKYGHLGGLQLIFSAKK